MRKQLGDLVSFISKGIAPKYADDSDKHVIRVLNQRCNRNSEIIIENARYNNLDKKKVPEERMLKENDIVINSTGTGTAGRIAQLRKEQLDVPTTVDSHMIILRAKDIDAKFLGYSLKAKLRQLESYAEGSTGQTEINRERLLNETIIDYPDNIEEQRKLVRQIECIDELIRLNKRINDNLVELLDSTYDYFLDSNPLESRKIDDIGSVIGGGTPSKKVKEYWNGTIPWITPKDLSISGNVFTSKGLTKISDLGYQNSSTKMLSAGSVLYSSRAPIGYISIANNPVTTNQGFKSIVPDKGYPTEFIFELLRNETNKIINSATGSTFKEVSGSQLKNHQIRIPDKSECNKFSNLVRPLFRNIKDLEYENQSLVKLRGLLLSKYF